MWRAVQDRSTNMWATLKSKLAAKPAQEGHIPMFLTRDDTGRNLAKINVTSPIQITVVPRETKLNPQESGESENSNDQHQEERVELSTFLTNHLECMYKFGASPMSVRTDSTASGCAGRLHKIAFFITGAISVSKGACDVKYFAINVAEDGTIRDVADLCYMIAKLILRGTVLYKFSRESEKIRQLCQTLDSLAKPEMIKAGWKKIILTGGIMMTICFLTPSVYLLVDFMVSDWSVQSFLERQFQTGLLGILQWSYSPTVYERFENVSLAAKYIGGILFTVFEMVTMIHELLTTYIMNTATITVHQMSESFRSELESSNYLPPSNDPRVGILRKEVSYKYERTKGACEKINDTFGTLFNFVHVLFILQWIFFVHTFLKNSSDPNIPCNMIELTIACVMYQRMGKISEVTDKFGDWICGNFRSAHHLEVEGQADGGISMTVLLEELRKMKIGIRGGVGVVTKAFMLVCFSLALEYFIELWNDTKA